MRVALVHDWLTGMRGGEKVLEELCLMFPEAPLHTLVHVPGSVSPVIEDRDVFVSPLSRLPGIGEHYRRFLPLFPRLIERFDLSGFDLVVSTSSCVAKGARAAPGARHVSMVFSPMRYVWDRFDDYFGPGRAGAATRAAMAVFREPLKRWDRASAARVDQFLANSRFVAARIRSYWSREAEIVPAPVDTDLYRPDGSFPGDSWLVVSAFTPYKRVDLALEAARLAGVPLTVVGRGPEEARLRAAAGSNARFLGWVDDEELAGIYARSRGLLFPGVEDFGITPLESMACGRPVIAFAQGGALETVRGAEWPGDPEAAGGERATGLFVREQTPEAFAQAIREVERRPDRVDPAACRARAEEFSRPVFRARLQEVLQGPLEGRSAPRG